MTKWVFKYFMTFQKRKSQKELLESRTAVVYEQIKELCFYFWWEIMELC